MFPLLAGGAWLAVAAAVLSWVHRNTGLALMLIGGAIAILGLIAHIRDTGRFRSFSLMSLYGMGVMLLALMFAGSGLGDLLGWWRIDERPLEQGPGRRTSESESGRPAGAARPSGWMNGG